ncbi:hypothetical protein [uncultured Stenotrophomonas sp.]|nr:hypothetical protein [uncultured Stenotrophomonas sp.]
MADLLIWPTKYLIAGLLLLIAFLIGWACSAAWRGVRWCWRRTLRAVRA